MKRGISLYFHMHQPWRVRRYSVFDTANVHDYFAEHDMSDRDNEKVFRKVADKSYRPMCTLLERLLAEQPDFKYSLSITGTFIEQARDWAPDILESVRRMVQTGRVEIVAETYYHSLAFFYSRDEFERQVALHRDVVRQMFGAECHSFRNTELAYNDELAIWADRNGFEAILAEGWDPVLGWRSPNYVYRPAGADTVRLLLKNYKLSDDIAFRFGNRDWPEYPLDAGKYQQWVEAAFADDAPLVNLFMDFETFGEHQWEDTGIFDFFGQFVSAWLAQPDHTFYTVRQAAHADEPRGDISMPHTVTWADNERDLTAWLGNSMQHEAMRHIYALEADVLRTGDIELIGDWRRLQTSDHTYYMCTKWFNDGDVHAYFSPYESPYDAFLYYMNALRDLRYRLMQSNRFAGY
ncbi:alpha-amylase [Candidatus Saccharibacteria bacterium]|nr:MAG: alpha-amylase [Candidatus Saccharibacteria bacterium]